MIVAHQRQAGKAGSRCGVAVAKAYIATQWDGAAYATAASPVTIMTSVSETALVAIS